MTYINIEKYLSASVKAKPDAPIKINKSSENIFSNKTDNTPDKKDITRPYQAVISAFFLSFLPSLLDIAEFNPILRPTDIDKNIKNIGKVYVNAARYAEPK